MPSNKKPRKKYVPKPVAFGYKQEDINTTKKIYHRVEAAIHFKLPNGEASFDDLCCVRDVFNHVHISCFIRKDFPDDQLEPVQKLLVDAGNANYDIITRGFESKRFVGTLDEIRVIREAMRVCAPYVDESLELCPGTFYKEWVFMKKVTEFHSDKPITTHVIATEKLRKQWERFCATGRL